MARARERLFTIEDWLGHQGEPDVRYELIDGQIVAMNPPKTWHGAIANQVGFVCATALVGRSPCRALQQVGIAIRREPAAKGYVADVVVTCEPIDENRPLVAAPRLVVEVVSAGTDRIDKVTKLADYMTVPSVEEIWLVLSTNRLVLHAVRRADGWSEPAALIGKAGIVSPVLETTVPLDDLYRHTPL